MTKHTPGPWWIDDRRVADGALQVQAQHRGEGSSYCVASVNGWEVPEANARLIAAAPDLLEACLSAENWLESWASAEPYLSIIRAAIKKATHCE